MGTLLALALAASPVVAPFPAPKVAQISDDLKYASGVIAAVAPGGVSVVVNTPAGPVTFITDKVQVIGKEGGALGGSASLQVGQMIRIYFFVADGARAREIDLT